MRFLQYAVSGLVLGLGVSSIHAEEAAPPIHPVYQPFRNVGFGFGFRNLFIALKHSRTDTTAQFDQSFRGPLLSMNASF